MQEHKAVSDFAHLDTLEVNNRSFTDLFPFSMFLLPPPLSISSSTVSPLFRKTSTSMKRPTAW